MNAASIDRIARLLARRTPRRAAVSGVAAFGLSTLGTHHATAKKKKKRCRKRLQTCGGKKKCCHKTGMISCQELPGSCADDRPGKRCCGRLGALCNPEFGTCDCCDAQFCALVDGEFRCTVT